MASNVKGKIKPSAPSQPLSKKREEKRPLPEYKILKRTVEPSKLSKPEEPPPKGKYEDKEEKKISEWDEKGKNKKIIIR